MERRVQDGFPRGGARRAARQRSCGATSRHATTTIRDKRARGRRRGARLGGAARGGRRDQGAHAAPPRRPPRARSRRGHSAPAAPCTGRATRAEAERDRRRDRRAGTAPTRSIKVKSLTTDEIGLNDALEARGRHARRDRPGRADRPARRRHRRRTSSCRRSTATAPRSATLFRRDARASSVSDEPARAGRGGARAPARAVPAARGRRQRRELRRRRDRARGACVESEGNGRMCTTLPEVLITVIGIEKVLPRWRDLEVMLQLLPRSSTGERMNPYTSVWTGVRRRRRPAGVPPRPARQRPHRRAGRRGRARRRCTASAARPA